MSIDSHLTSSELNTYYASGELSPVDVIKSVFERVARYQPIVNAFSIYDYDNAMLAAKASEKRWLSKKPLGPLDGVPTTIKDIVLSRDWKTSYGSKVIGTNSVSSEDAPCIERLKEAGAILIGMTTTPELGWKAVTDSPLLGITRNPWDANKTPGGSSGGAAVAAALDMGVMHIGTDGGGSIRIPAGFTGIVGHKPSFGRVPAYPMSAFGTVAHIGPMTRTVRDAALMLSTLAKPDARDWYALPYDKVDYSANLDLDLKGLNIAYSPDLGYVKVDPGVAENVKKAALRFAELGANVEEISPEFECPQDIFHGLWFSGAAQRFGDLPPEKMKLLDAGLQEIVAIGSGYSTHDYLELSRQRAELGKKMSMFHKKWDLLLTPTISIPAFDAGMETPDGKGRWTDWAGFSYPFNLTQQPACSVPCGLTAAGLPVGLQIVGANFEDRLVLQAAHAFEKTQERVFPRVENLNKNAN